MKRKTVKTLLAFLIIFSMIFTLCSCSPDGKSSSCKVTLGQSDKFSDKELNDAVNCIKEKFKEFKGCTLLELRYDEEKSDKEVSSYMECGHGSGNGVEKENVIIFYSDFYAGHFSSDGFNSNFTYTDWMWILIRDSATDEWVADDWGY